MCAAKTKKGEKTLKNLQQALSMELTATHQYLLHAHVLEDWGLDRLATKMNGEVQEELGHASRFIDRILFLNGDPVVTEAKPTKRSTSLTEMFKAGASSPKFAQVATASGRPNRVGLFSCCLLFICSRADRRVSR
jgi:bacterioferritin